jgi:hypothetical protein
VRQFRYASNFGTGFKKLSPWRPESTISNRVNSLVGLGECRLEFLDNEGKRVKVAQKVGEVLRLK